MDFLNPTAMAIAAGVTIPPLAALYFLKLKREVRLVPSTLLWRKAVEDLQVNSPFQRLRSSLLLILQLLILILAALALGKPMMEMAQVHRDSVILLIDQSASMGVMEADGQTRLEKAKRLARKQIDNLGEGARAMVIAFSDRATVVASFDLDNESLKRKIDDIGQTQSASRLTEAVNLAEAHAQNIIIGTSQSGADIAPVRPVSPDKVYIITDGCIEDSREIALQQFDISSIEVMRVGKRTDNVGIMNMGVRRQYERPEILQVTAEVQQYGPDDIKFDAVLYVDQRSVDVKSVTLAGYRDDPSSDASASQSVIAFDDVVESAGGVVEVVLRVDDALSADDRAWTVIDPPQHVSVLLVTDKGFFLRPVLETMAIDLTIMQPDAYESARVDQLEDNKRSKFDVVIMDRHSTDRLPRGNYFFWGAIPKIEGLAIDGSVENQIVFDWDDTHPLLRHVATETLEVLSWLNISWPPEAVSIIDGPKSAILAQLSRGGNQYLISAFSLVAENESGELMMNTFWPTSVDFVIFMQNAVQYLSGTAAAANRRSLEPGQPVSLPIPADTQTVVVTRPDQRQDRIETGQYDTLHYSLTRQVGVYEISPSLEGANKFAVNLFNPEESNIAPAGTLTLGVASLDVSSQAVEVNRPAWRYALLALLAILFLEWVVYNRRVFV